LGGVEKGTTMAFLEVFDEKTISDTTWTTDELKKELVKA